MSERGRGSTLGQQELVTACERVWKRKSCGAVAAVRSGLWLWLGCGAGASAYASDDAYAYAYASRVFKSLIGANTQQEGANTSANTAIILCREEY